eukprot:TRINITY_DN12990_c0_g1_i1.p1 TRINITY_DN12990_c0_g1~~TRINITY_DN12990_c0_g1_i1.p1  ORF type:complete len:493 (+),score=165.11 TRINITY_DN12990_c0_g1_i1:261-1739(+)
MGNDISNPISPRGGGDGGERMQKQPQQQQEPNVNSQPNTAGEQPQQQVTQQTTPGTSSSNTSTTATTSTSSAANPSEAEGPPTPVRSSNAVRMVAAKPVGPAHDPMETPPTAQPESKPKKSSSKIKQMFLPSQQSSQPSIGTTATPSPSADESNQTTSAQPQAVAQLAVPPPSTQPPTGSQSERSAASQPEVPEAPARAKGATVSGVVPDIDYAAILRQMTTTQSPDDQAKTFLRAFVYDFAVPAKFEEVLNICEQFKKAAPQGNIRELDISTAQTFMANHGIASEGIDFRAMFNMIDVDANMKLSLIEFLLYKYRKPLASLFSAKPEAQAVQAMDNNIAVYRKVLEEKRETEERMALLDKAVDRVDRVVDESKVTIAIKPAAPTQSQQPASSSQSSQSSQEAIVKSYGKTQLRSATAKAALENRSRAKEAKDQVQGINAVMAQTLAGAHERGERLQTMETKTAELANNANEYMKSIQKLRKQQENKSWWQL